MTDLKPSNILLSEQRPAVRLLDFGLSKMVRGETRAMTTQLSMTLAGQLMGTPQYMSPEQIRDSQAVTPATDVYSLGITLYQALAAWPPFAGEDLASLCLAHLTEPPADIRTRAAAVPDALAALLHRCLAKQAADRPTAEELSAGLTEIADELGTPDAAACAASELHGLSLSQERQEV